MNGKDSGEKSRPILLRVPLSKEEAEDFEVLSEYNGLSPQKLARFGLQVLKLAMNLGEQSGEPCALAIVVNPHAIAGPLPENVVFVEPPKNVADRGDI